jgi:iron complex outermembrane receptor protein
VLADVPEGAWMVSIRRLGYGPATRTIQLPADSLVAELRLAPSAVDLAAVTVTTPGRRRSADELFQPVAVLDGAALDRALTTSVAATVAREPGVWVRTNGPVAAQPVIRGLGGRPRGGARGRPADRRRRDHRPRPRRHRRPAFGAARGGGARSRGAALRQQRARRVVNVVREDVPRERPARVTGFLAGRGRA